jgi:hypothetical protein
MKMLSVELDEGDWAFVVSGLRDLTETVLADGSLSEKGRSEIMQRNVRLANTIEDQFLAQLPICGRG